MIITKEMIFDQFKDATKKDQSKKKETFTHRVSFLKTLIKSVKFLNDKELYVLGSLIVIMDIPPGKFLTFKFIKKLFKLSFFSHFGSYFGS